MHPFRRNLLGHQLTIEGVHLLLGIEVSHVQVVAHSAAEGIGNTALHLHAMTILGHDVIMTPNQYYYLDYYQSKDQQNEPLAIGGYVPVEKCYSYEPYTEDMTEEQRAHILGVQANLWTEYIATQDYLEYMLMPRLAALSEVQWCQPENKDWERFLDSADEICSRYEAAGYNYAKHILEVQKQSQELVENE